MEQADLVFVLNEAMARNVTEHLNVTKEKLRLITNGVNTRIYHPLEQEENEKTKETWGLAGKRVFLQVGSVYENKGQLRMLQALAPVLKEDKDAVFAFVGGIVSPEYHEEVLKTAEEIGLREQVRYLGTVCPGEELNRLYSMADAMVVASRYEGFSLVIAEAMAAGTPVLLHKASPYSLGEGCVYFDEDTVKDAIAGLNHELSAAARANAEENLTWDAVAKKYLQALRKEKVLRT